MIPDSHLRLARIEGEPGMGDAIGTGLVEFLALSFACSLSESTFVLLVVRRIRAAAPNRLAFERLQVLDGRRGGSHHLLVLGPRRDRVCSVRFVRHLLPSVNPEFSSTVGYGLALCLYCKYCRPAAHRAGMTLGRSACIAPCVLVRDKLETGPGIGNVGSVCTNCGERVMGQH
jgi:hypothetical protein